jgi:hypothetical protein
MRLRPGMDVLSELERLAADVAGELEIANTLWAYATLGRQPGAGLVSGLERRAADVAGKFKPQAIANTLWAYAVLDAPPRNGPFPSELCKAAVCHCFDPFDDKVGKQVHMFLVVAKLRGWTTRGDSGLIDALRSKFGSRGRDLLAQSSVAKKSRLQADVASCVRRLGLECEEEAIDGESVYSIDILVSHCGEHGDVGVGKVALEVGGPSHYLLSRRRTANGNTVVLKRRVLSMPGYTSVSVPFWAQ